MYYPNRNRQYQKHKNKLLESIKFIINYYLVTTNTDDVQQIIR